MGDRGLGDLAAGGEVTGAGFPVVRELPHDGQPGRVGKRLEQDHLGVGQLLHDLSLSTIFNIDQYRYRCYGELVGLARRRPPMLANTLSLLADVATKVVAIFAHNWFYLLVGIFGAVAVQVYVGTDKVAGWLRRRRGAAVAGSGGAVVATPLCSCGTTAVVLSMLASTVPWAPVVAFMVASPLTSPSELFYSAGLFGWPFALVFFIGSIALGLAAGGVAAVLERLGWLRNPARFTTTCGTTCGTTPAPAASLGPGAASVLEFPRSRAARWRLPELWRALLTVSRRTLPLFFGFAALGYLVTALVPQAWINDWLGGSSPLATVVAATLGIPLAAGILAALLVLGAIGYVVAAMLLGGLIMGRVRQPVVELLAGVLVLQLAALVPVLGLAGPLAAAYGLGAVAVATWRTHQPAPAAPRPP